MPEKHSRGPRHGPPCPPDSKVAWLVLRLGCRSPLQQPGGQQWCREPWGWRQSTPTLGNPCFSLAYEHLAPLSFIHGRRGWGPRSVCTATIAVLCMGSATPLLCPVSTTWGPVRNAESRAPPPHSASALTSSAGAGMGVSSPRPVPSALSSGANRESHLLSWYPHIEQDPEFSWKCSLPYKEKNVDPFFAQGCSLGTSPRFNGKQSGDPTHLKVKKNSRYSFTMEDKNWDRS